MILRFFYKEYDSAYISKWFVIKNEYFNTAEFKETRRIKLPDCVMYVTECKVASNLIQFNLGESGLSISRMVAADIFLGAYSSDDLTTSIANMSYYDLTKAFLKDWISYDFNENSKILHLEGESPLKDLALLTYVKVDEDALFEDYLFIDYVRGLSLESMGRMMGVFDLNLPGNVKINSDMLRSQGREMVEEVKKKLEEMQPSNFILYYVFGFRYTYT